MYGLPDSAILGTAKRVSRMGRIKKRRYEIDSYETGWGRIVAKWINSKDRKAQAKHQQKRLERKHKVKFV